MKGKQFVEECLENANAHHVRPQIYTDYAHVYADAEVDIVYIGTPHALHKEACLAAVEAGKHVLCEKPITINARDAKEVVAAARAKGVFLMEGKILSFPISSLTILTFLFQLSGLGSFQSFETCSA